MKVGIYNQHLGGFHQGYLEKYEKILKHNGIECIWLEASAPDFWQEISNLNLFIFQWEHYDGPRQIAKTIIPIIEYQMRVPCFPDWSTSWHFDDKIRQYYLLKYHGFPITETNVFWKKEEALKWLESAQMPVVFKLKVGAGSTNVILVRNRRTAKKLIMKMFGKGVKPGRILDKNSLFIKHYNPYRQIRRFLGNSIRKFYGEYEAFYWQIDKGYIMFQKFLPDNSFDTRVSVIGERAFAFRRFNRENDFRASGSGIIDYDTSKIDLRSIEIAFSISKKLGFQSMAYDFLFNESNDLEICEISYTYVDKAVFDCPGYWDKNMEWHEGHFWPQYLQLVDALNLPDLKQPVI